MQRNRQQTSIKIKQAAIRLLSREGFAEWGINAISREAGVDKVLIYRYFNSLDGLLETLIEETWFWPDPESLRDESAEAFIQDTIEYLERNPIPYMLRSVPSAREIAKRKSTHDLNTWLEFIRDHSTGHISDSQLSRVPGRILLQVIQNDQTCTASEIWREVSPPLNWISDQSVMTFDELPTELL